MGISFLHVQICMGVVKYENQGFSLCDKKCAVGTWRIMVKYENQGQDLLGRRNMEMKELLKLVNKVEKEANAFSNWGFTTMPTPEGDGFLVGAQLQSKAGDMLNVIFDIRKKESAIAVFMPGCVYREEVVKQQLGLLGFPVHVSGKNGEMLLVRSKFETGRLNTDLNVVIQGMMMEMINALNRIYTEGKKN